VLGQVIPHPIPHQEADAGAAMQPGPQLGTADIDQGHIEFDQVGTLDGGRFGGISKPIGLSVPFW